MVQREKIIFIGKINHFFFVIIFKYKLKGSWLRTIGDKFKLIIICEFGINHKDSLKIEKKMVEMNPIEVPEGLIEEQIKHMVIQAVK